MSSSIADRPECYACGRNVRPGIACRQTVCPYALTVKRGNVVLARPLRLRIK